MHTRLAIAKALPFTNAAAHALQLNLNRMATTPFNPKGSFQQWAVAKKIPHPNITDANQRTAWGVQEFVGGYINAMKAVNPADQQNKIEDMIKTLKALAKPD
jgi:hypothetical protein